VALLGVETDDVLALELAIKKWNRSRSKPVSVDPYRVPLPYLKGFDDLIGITDPYYVWELHFPETH